jgi:hypothetical protein
MNPAMPGGAASFTGNAAHYSKLSADQAMPGGTPGMNPAMPGGAASFSGNAAHYSKLSADQAMPGGLSGYRLGMDVRVVDEGVLPAFAPEAPSRRSRNARRRRGWRRGVEPVESRTPGEGILNSIQAVRNEIMEIERTVVGLMSRKQDFSTADLMKMQYHVMQLTYINELSSKTADKASQGAQTLFRNQG